MVEREDVRRSPIAATCSRSRARSIRSRGSSPSRSPRATHGRPNEANAHPHATPELALVHNGIIENFRKLRIGLKNEGVRFASETDTEVVAQLVSHEMRAGKAPREAVLAVLPRLSGAFSLAFLFEGEEDLIIGARRGSPLAVGHGEGEMFLGSDALALAPFTDDITYLEEGDVAILTRTSARLLDERGNPVERRRTRVADLSLDKEMLQDVVRR